MSNTQTSGEEPSTDERGLEGEYDPEAVERKWQRRWVEEETYAYPGGDTAYSIDTPPPTVSGSLHMGHLYGHTLQDFVARYERMADGPVLFPFGYDDNGIASERLTEAELDIHHGDYDRREFQQLCREVCQRYEQSFTEQMQALGCSIDWSRTYKTIEPRIQRLSQLSFLDLYEQGREYRRNAPTIWCPECETAISQVEQEDAEKDTTFNDIAFDVVETGDGSPAETLTISTTRPELLPACVSVFVHPDDDENEHLVGGTARVPLFGQEVPILEDDRVDLETGTGVVMCCTFGDQTDIEWYQAHDLDLRLAIDESGTMTDVAGEYEGLSTTEAREQIIAELGETGHLLDSREHTHAVGVHERCEREVEYLVTEQWYVELLDRKEEYLEAGRQMTWYPEKMFTRYRHWIEGLEWDWCISRQRDSGIPFPVWYCGACEEVVTAEREQLPVDPLEDEPPVDACPECGSDEFVPEQDVFDTWATSSLTPLINAGWDWNEETGEFEIANAELYPMNLRPQGHDIISFWLFHTIVKCYEHTGEVPFEAVLINGHVLDENRQKMSKSKGNVVLPEEVMAERPIDAIRFWAASAAVGDDFPFSEKDIVAGEKLLRKLWNASKLVDRLTSSADALSAGATAERDAPALDQIDRWLLANLDETIRTVTDHFERMEFAKARTHLRGFFWHTFCDDYLEIAKERDTESTAYALEVAHRTFLLLWAPLLPHITEEIWQARYGQTSVHHEPWPTPRGYEADIEAGETAMEVISALRRYKSDAGLALNATLASVEVYGDVAGFADAIADVMHVDSIETVDDEPEITTEVVGVDLEYSLVGPEFGAQVSEIDAAIDAGEFEPSGDELVVADEFVLEAEMFELEKERTYSGAGELLETDSAVVIVR